MAPGLTPRAMVPLGAAWADLAARALEPNIFNDPAFALPAALHLSGRRRPRFLVARDPGDPSRLIGLCCVAAPVPGFPLSAWLHPQATAAFPLLDAARAGEALAVLLGQTRGRLRAAALLMHGVPAHGATMQLVSRDPGWTVIPVEERGRAVVRDAPAPLAAKGGKEFRRQARRLAEQGRVAVTTATTLAACEDFLRLEAQGWKGRRTTALASDPRRARFARAMLAALVGQGRCQVHSLTVDRHPAAMGLVLRAGPHAFFWKTTFDEAYRRFSPGAHLAEAIGRVQARVPGLALTDSCAVPGHSMIDRLWPERMVVVDALVIPATAPSLRHRLALRAEQLRRAVRAWARHAAGRLSGAGSARHNVNMAEP